MSRCSHVWCRSRRFNYILLVFFRRWSRLVMRDLIKHDALLWLVVFQQLWLVHFDPCCTFSDLLPRRSAVIQLSCCWVLIVGIPRFWNFYSTIPVDVVKLYFVLEWLVSGVVGMLWNSGGLGKGELNASIVLLNSVLHRSSSLSDVYLAAFTGNPVNLQTENLAFIVIHHDE